uniref:Uncharacterized protein n=1 Tax=Triticum urartu TaxID=4572 RepID=A0A8R7V3Z6_TRIUA
MTLLHHSFANFWSICVTRCTTCGGRTLGSIESTRTLKWGLRNEAPLIFLCGMHCARRRNEIRLSKKSWVRLKPFSRKRQMDSRSGCFLV